MGPTCTVDLVVIFPAESYVACVHWLFANGPETVCPRVAGAVACGVTPEYCGVTGWLDDKYDRLPNGSYPKFWVHSDARFPPVSANWINLFSGSYIKVCVNVDGF